MTRVDLRFPQREALCGSECGSTSKSALLCKPVLTREWMQRFPISSSVTLAHASGNCGFFLIAQTSDWLLSGATDYRWQKFSCIVSARFQQTRKSALTLVQRARLHLVPYRGPHCQNTTMTSAGPGLFKPFADLDGESRNNWSENHAPFAPYFDRSKRAILRAWKLTISLLPSFAMTLFR